MLNAKNTSQLRYCPVCDNAHLIALDFPKAQAMRSDGILISEQLIKLHCVNCGVLVGGNSQIKTPYARSSGNSPYELARHKNVAEGFARCIEKLSRKTTLTVLEVGAANFQTALLLKGLKKNYHISALERHPELIPQTMDISIIVDDFFNFKISEKFNVCYSNHVIEHFDDPIAFLRQSREAVADNGIVITCCPTFVTPSNELLFADHIFHFTANAMLACAGKVGLELLSETVSDWDPLTHIYIFRKIMEVNPYIQNKYSAHSTLLYERQDILKTWLLEDDKMSKNLVAVDKVVIYGAGEFTQLVRAYLPKLWSRVKSLVVDNLDGIREFDRPIFHIDEYLIDQREVFLIGAHKKSQAVIYQKLIDKQISNQNIFSFSV